MSIKEKFKNPAKDKENFRTSDSFLYYKLDKTEIWYRTKRSDRSDTEFYCEPENKWLPLDRLA